MRGTMSPSDYLTPPAASAMEAADIMWNLARRGVLFSHAVSRTELERLYSELTPPTILRPYMSCQEPPTLLACLSQLWLSLQKKTLFVTAAAADIKTVERGIEAGFVAVVHLLHLVSANTLVPHELIKTCRDTINQAKLPQTSQLYKLALLYGAAPKVATQLRACSNTSCNKLEVEGRSHRVCSGCRRTQYCSVECQVWSTGGDACYFIFFFLFPFCWEGETKSRALGASMGSKDK